MLTFNKSLKKTCTIQGKNSKSNIVLMRRHQNKKHKQEKSESCQYVKDIAPNTSN